MYKGYPLNIRDVIQAFLKKHGKSRDDFSTFSLHKKATIYGNEVSSNRYYREALDCLGEFVNIPSAITNKIHLFTVCAPDLMGITNVEYFDKRRRADMIRFNIDTDRLVAFFDSIPNIESLNGRDFTSEDIGMSLPVSAGDSLVDLIPLGMGMVANDKFIVQFDGDPNVHLICWNFFVQNDWWVLQDYYDSRATTMKMTHYTGTGYGLCLSLETIHNENPDIHILTKIPFVSSSVCCRDTYSGDIAVNPAIVSLLNKKIKEIK